VHASKTERPRTIKLLALLVHDLAELARRIYQPAAKATGVSGGPRVYRLRGSFVSLRLWESRV
jgi:hypothetical protein